MWVGAWELESASPLQRKQRRDVMADPRLVAEVLDRNICPAEGVKPAGWDLDQGSYVFSPGWRLLDPPGWGSVRRRWRCTQHPEKVHQSSTEAARRRW